jgi:hypothetical protein
MNSNNITNNYLNSSNNSNHTNNNTINTNSHSNNNQNGNYGSTNTVSKLKIEESHAGNEANPKKVRNLYSKLDSKPSNNTDLNSVSISGSSVNNTYLNTNNLSNLDTNREISAKYTSGSHYRTKSEDGGSVIIVTEINQTERKINGASATASAGTEQPKEKSRRNLKTEVVYTTPSVLSDRGPSKLIKRDEDGPSNLKAELSKNNIQSNIIKNLKENSKYLKKSNANVNSNTSSCVYPNVSTENRNKNQSIEVTTRVKNNQSPIVNAETVVNDINDTVCESKNYVISTENIGLTHRLKINENSHISSIIPKRKFLNTSVISVNDEKGTSINSKQDSFDEKMCIMNFKKNIDKKLTMSTINSRKSSTTRRKEYNGAHKVESPFNSIFDDSPKRASKIRINNFPIANSTILKKNETLLNPQSNIIKNMKNNLLSQSRNKEKNKNYVAGFNNSMNNNSMRNNSVKNETNSIKSYTNTGNNSFIKPGNKKENFNSISPSPLMNKNQESSEITKLLNSKMLKKGENFKKIINNNNTVTDDVYTNFFCKKKIEAILQIVQSACGKNLVHSKNIKVKDFIYF